MEWLEQKIWPLERHLKAAHVRAATRLACLEMLTSGTTTFHDMYFQAESAAAAAERDGHAGGDLPGLLRPAQADDPCRFCALELARGAARAEPVPRVTPSVGPHAAYTVSLEALAEAYRLAEEHDAVVHFHLAETEREIVDFRRQHGRGLVEALDAAGFLGPRLVAAHGIWLDDEDVRTLGERGVTIVHCPSSNMKLGSGWSGAGARALPYTALRRAGVRVALGTDGAAANNYLDMFESMKLAALLQKHATGDPAVLSAHEAFAMATEAGADALRIDAGRIQPGCRADLVLIDLDRPYLAPGHDLVADLVYAGRPDCVDTVIVDGQVVLRARSHPDVGACDQRGTRGRVRPPRQSPPGRATTASPLDDSRGDRTYGRRAKLQRCSGPVGAIRGYAASPGGHHRPRDGLRARLRTIRGAHRGLAERSGRSRQATRGRQGPVPGPGASSDTPPRCWSRSGPAETWRRRWRASMWPSGPPWSPT